MNSGLYRAASGGLASARRIDLISHNLANINTVGYKAERLITRQQQFADTLTSKMGDPTGRAESDFIRTPGVVSVGTFTDFSQGPIASTSNPLHVALQNENEFFVVQGPEGPAYTRAGNFTLGSDNTLVTQDGIPVLGEGGPLTLPAGAARISSTGRVTVDGEVIGALQVARFEDTSVLRRQEGTRFTVAGGQGSPTQVPAQVIPESVEMPNVSVVEAMVDMIAANRAFEAYSKTARTIDDINERAIRSARGSG